MFWNAWILPASAQMKMMPSFSTIITIQPIIKGYDFPIIISLLFTRCKKYFQTSK